MLSKISKMIPKDPKSHLGAGRQILARRLPEWVFLVSPVVVAGLDLHPHAVVKAFESENTKSPKTIFLLPNGTISIAHFFFQ